MATGPVTVEGVFWSNRATPTRRAAAAAALSLSALLAGCSGSNSGSSSSTSAPSPGATVDAKALADRITTAQRDAKYVHVTQVATGGTAVQVDLHFTGSGGRDIDLKDGTTSGMRKIGGDYYLYSNDVTDGKPWMSVLQSDTSGEADAVRKAMVTGAAGYATTDSQANFTHGKATYVGSDRDGGHYRVVVPAETVYASLVSEVGAQDKATLAGKTVTYDVWLGDKDRVNKLVLTAAAFKALQDDSSSGSSQSSATPGMTVTYSKWGQQVSITRPPADKTVSVDVRMGQIGGRGSSTPSGGSSSGASSSGGSSSGAASSGASSAG